MLTLPALHPGRGFVDNVERAVRLAERRIRHLYVQGGRQYLVVQRQGRLHEAGDARRRFGVADHRLDRSDGAALRRCAGSLEDARQRLDLRRVANDSSRAVRFNQAYRGRRHTCLCVGTLECQRLPFRPRCAQASTASVARPGDALDDGIHAIPVPLGVLQALQHEHRETFADRDSVRPGVERPATPSRRQRLRLAETEEPERALNGIDAADQHHVARAAFELRHPQVYGGERGGTGRVHRIVHAPEIEPVGHTPRSHVEQNSGEGVFGPFRQSLNRACGHLTEELGQVRAHAIVETEIAQASAQSKDDRRPIARELTLEVSGVGEGLTRHLEREQLEWIDGRERRRWNPVAPRIELHVGQKSAPSRVHLVARLAVGSKCRSMSNRSLGTSVIASTLLITLAKCLDVRRLWKQAAHPMIATLLGATAGGLRGHVRQAASSNLHGPSRRCHEIGHVQTPV